MTTSRPATSPLSEAEVHALVAAKADELLNLTSTLVRTPSENRAPHGDEKACQEILRDYLTDDRLVIDMFTPTEVVGVEDHEAWWPGRDYSNRPNLVATLRGSGGGKSVILNGHMDTVTREPLPWGAQGPFSGKVVDGKLYGRGTYDMKAGLAAQAVALKILAEQGITLRGDVILESVVDEENAGANGTLACCVRGYEADLVIITEPTNMEICPQTRGGQVFSLTTRGHGGVNYAGEGFTNPATKMAQLLVSLHEYEQEIAKPNETGNTRSIVLAKVSSGDLSPGGNIGIPAKAWAEFFVQTNPGMTEAELQAEVKQAVLARFPQTADDVQVELEPSSRYLFPADTPFDHESVQLITQAYEELLGNAPKPTEALIAGDGSLFNRYFDTPSVHIGPKGANAHGPSEYIETDSLIDLTKVLLLTIARWCA